VTTCRACKAPIVWARTAASETGRGGKAMPLDATPNDGGNVAVRMLSPNSRVARVLGKDETHDRRAEQLYMPHFATCLGNQADQLHAEIEQYLAEQP